MAAQTPVVPIASGGGASGSYARSALPAALVLGGVVVTIGLGFYSLHRGGEFARAWSNKLMRVRIALQDLAVVLLVAWFVVHGGHM